MSQIVRFTVKDSYPITAPEDHQAFAYAEARCFSKEGIDLEFILRVNADSSAISHFINLPEKTVLHKCLWHAAKHISTSGRLDPKQDVIIHLNEHTDGFHDEDTSDIALQIEDAAANKLLTLTGLYNNEKASFYKSVEWLRDTKGGYHLDPMKTLSHMRLITSHMRNARSLYMGPNLREHATKIERAALNLVKRKNTNHAGYVQEQSTLLESLYRADYRMT
jgi:hypothetical protein